MFADYWPFCLILAIVSALLGIGLFLVATVGGRSARAGRSAAAAITAATIPVLILSLGMAFAHRPGLAVRPVPTASLAIGACLLLGLTELAMIAISLRLVITGEEARMGIMLGGLFILFAFALETIGVLLAAGQLIAGAGF